MAATRLAQRPQLSEEVADHVRTRIMSGRVRPGDFVRLDETAASLGVSVTPVREALLTLRGEGLVDLVPRRGYVVSPMSRQDIEDIFWLQTVLAKRLVDRAARWYDDDDVEQHSLLIGEFETADRVGDAEAIIRAQYAIHRTINLAARSDKLSRFLSNAGRYLPYGLYAEDPDWRAAALEDNRRMLEALRAGDVATAHSVVDDEYGRGARLLIEHLDRAGVWDEQDRVAEQDRGEASAVES